MKCLNSKDPEILTGDIKDACEVKKNKVRHFKMSRAVVFKWEFCFPEGDIWLCLETFWLSQLGKSLLMSGG